jgi:hypothetical protein
MMRPAIVLRRGQRSFAGSQVSGLCLNARECGRGIVGGFLASVVLCGRFINRRLGRYKRVKIGLRRSRISDDGQQCVHRLDAVRAHCPRRQWRVQCHHVFFLLNGCAQLILQGEDFVANVEAGREFGGEYRLVIGDIGGVLGCLRSTGRIASLLPQGFRSPNRGVYRRIPCQCHRSNPVPLKPLSGEPNKLDAAALPPVPSRPRCWASNILRLRNSSADSAL